MSQFQNNSIFWVEVEKIKPNPYQPRREFDENRLKDLAESIRMYGVLQPLTVTRQEVHREDGLAVEYELIAGERRWRASRLAGIAQVPVIIRSGPEDAKIKLELAIIENLQREDLNPIDRAKAFQQLADEFGFTHAEIAKKVGKSREYVSNTIRLLQLPEDIQQALVEGRISEGHTRPLGMLKDRPDEQMTVFKEVMLKKLTVRETETIARKIAHDRVRKKNREVDPEVVKMEKRLSETLGTRVQIEPREVGGKLVIDYFSPEDLQHIIDVVNASLLNENRGLTAAMNRYEEALQDDGQNQNESEKEETNEGVINNQTPSDTNRQIDTVQAEVVSEPETQTQDEPKNNTSPEDKWEDDLYGISRFSL